MDTYLRKATNRKLGGPALASVLVPALAIVLAAVVSFPDAAAQTTSVPVADPVTEIIFSLTNDLECTASGTATAFEQRLTRRVEPVRQIKLALKAISDSGSYCAEIRGAAARQMLRLPVDAAELQQDAESGETEQESLAGFTFSSEAPPLNLVRRRGEGA